MPRSLIGPPSAGQKVHRWTYLSLPFLHMSLGRSPFVERRFQFASRRFFVINLQTAQRRNAKSKREKERRERGEIQGDTMPGINERVNKSKEGREDESERKREGKGEVAGQRARGNRRRGKRERLRARVRGQDEDGSTETSLPRCIRFLRASDDSRLFTGARGHLAAIRVKEEAQRAR